MGIEYELKFQADAQTLEAIRRSVTGAEQEFSMETTYYDTPDRALSARKYTLRCRKENGVSICALKAPIAGAGRGEWELNCPQIEDAISGLCALGAPGILAELTQKGLIPICGARFTRIAKTLVLPECTVELALDQGVLLGGGKTLPFCEVEVELKDGQISACDDYARQLAQTFSLTAQTRSKFRRALALQQGEI